MTPQELKNSIIHIAMRGRLVEQRSNEGSAAELYKSIIEEKKAAGVKPNKKLEPVTEDVIPFEIPDSWMWVRFGDIVDYRMGKTPPREDLKWWNSDVPWVAISDMPESGHIASTKEAVSFAAIKEKFSDRVSPAGTMIMSFKLTVGRVSILDIDAVHNEAIISIFPYADKDNTIQSYLFMLLPTVTQYGDTKNAIKGKTLNATSICNLLIPLPPLSEQKRIVTKIDELLPLVERYGEAWTKLEAFNKKFPDDMKKSILQQAIQGKLVEQKEDEYVDVSKINKKKNSSIETLEFEIPNNWAVGTIESVCELVPTKQYQILENQVLPTGKFPVISQSKEYQIGFTNEESKLYHVKEPLVAFGDHTTVVKYIDFDFVVGADGLKLFKPNEIIIYKYLYYALQFLTCGLGKVGGYSRHYKFFKNKPMPIPPLAEQKRIVAKIEELLPLCEKLK